MPGSQCNGGALSTIAVPQLTYVEDFLTAVGNSVQFKKACIFRAINTVQVQACAFRGWLSFPFHGDACPPFLVRAKILGAPEEYGLQYHATGPSSI